MTVALNDSKGLLARNRQLQTSRLRLASCRLHHMNPAHRRSLSRFGCVDVIELRFGAVYSQAARRRVDLHAPQQEEERRTQTGGGIAGDPRIHINTSELRVKSDCRKIQLCRHCPRLSDSPPSHLWKTRLRTRQTSDSFNCRVHPSSWPRIL